MKASLGLALGLALLAWCRPALACTCGEPWHIIPDGVRDVPANTKIWIAESRAKLLLGHHWRANADARAAERPNLDATNLRAAIVLQGPNGEVSELGVSSLDLNGLGRFFVVAPHHELTPGAHVLSARIPQNAKAREDFGELGAHFEIGTARAATSRAAPSARVLRWINEEGDYCGSSVGAELQVSPSHWLLAYRIIDPSRPNDTKSTREGYRLAHATTFIGDGPCSSSWDFSRSSAVVRFGTLDYSGNFSGYGPPLRLDAPWSPAELRAQTMAKVSHRPLLSSRGCACRLEGPSGGALGWGAWLFLLGGLMRRRWRPRFG